MAHPGRRRALRHAAAAGASLLLGACRPAPRDDPRPGEAPFAEGALRLDLRHSTADARDAFDLVRLRAEPLGGAGTGQQAEAPDWGDYRLTLYDAASDTLLFRQGFDSALERSTLPRTTELSVRVPMPLRTARALIERRRAGSVFQEVWSTDVDPADRAIDRSAPMSNARVHPLLASGDPAAKADIAILGDGYTGADHAKFVADAKRAMSYVFSVQPMAGRVRDFNVHAVFVPSAQSGVTDAYLGVDKDTVFGCAYGEGEAERTLAVGNLHALSEAAAAAPYDFLLVMANARRYGGSARFGGPAVVAIDSGASRYLVLHELAHAIAGLAEEYYIPDAGGPAYGGNVEPWNPNVTIAASSAKWLDAAGAAPRTLAWNKAQYEREFAQYVRRYFALRERGADEGAIEHLMAEARGRQRALLTARGDSRAVGLFEGANGYATGAFRSEADCIMFSLQSDYFCSACIAAWNRAIDSHSA